MLGSDLLHSLPFAAQLRVNIAAIITASGYWQMAETLWEETQQINASAGSVTEKMQQVAALLLRQQPYLPVEWQEAVGVISAVQRQVAALLAQPEGSESSMLERTQRVLQSLSSLVNSPVVAAWLPGLIREHLDALFNQGRLIVGALNSLLSGGHSLSFEDYLAQVLALGDAIAPELLTPLRTLATQIRHIVAPWQDATFPTWPEPATPAAMLGWLQSVLMHPLFRETVLPRLPEEYRQALTSALHLSQQAGTFPVQGTTHEQLQWLLTQIHNPDLRQLMAQAGLETYLTTLREQLSGDAASELFSLFLQLINPNQTVAQRLGNLIAGIFRGSVLTGAVSAGLRWMPGGQVLEPLFRLGMHWYQRTLLAPTWAATLGNFLRVVQEDLSGNVLVMDLVARLTGVMPPSAAEAMRTLQTIHAFQLQRDLTTPDDTLRWVLAGAVHYPELKPWYQNYLNLMLAWSVKKILESRDVRTQQQEVAHLQAWLSEPEWQLWPGVAQLSALLPLLPLLPAIREELGERTLPTGNSWLEWSAAVADILAVSEHPALQQVRRQLEQNIEAWISDTLLQAMTGDARRRLLTSRRLPERWSMAGISPEGMREEGDIWLSGGEMFIREQGRMYRVEPDAEHGVLRLIKPGETHASGASPRVLREDGRWRLDLRPAAGLPGGSPVAGMDMSGGIIRLGQDDMDWLASEETQRVAKVATGVGLGIWWLGTLYAFWRSYHQPAPASYRAAPQEAAPAQPPSHEAAARLLNPPVTETVVEMGEPQNTDTTPGRWQRAAALGRRYRVPLGMTALGAISSAAYLQWLLRNPEQDVLSEEDLTALQAVLAQRDYQIVIDLPQPERHDRVRRAVGRRLLAEESTTPAPEVSPEYWPALPRKTAIDSRLGDYVHTTFPQAVASATAAEYSLIYPEEKVYQRNGYDYLYVDGNYRCITLHFTMRADRVVPTAGVLYSNQEWPASNSMSVKVNFDPVAMKWCLDASGISEIPASASPQESNKMTSASAALNREAGTWSAEHAFTYDEEDPGRDGAIYQDDRLYIFLHGRYWPFLFINDDLGAISNGSGTTWVNRKQNEWDIATTLRPMVMPGRRVVSEQVEKWVEQEFDPRKAYQPRPGDFKSSIENGIYRTASKVDTYIYVATNFWPVNINKSDTALGYNNIGTIFEKKLDYSAKTIRIIKNRQSMQWEDRDKLPSTRHFERPRNTSASVWLTEEAELWDANAASSAGFHPTREGNGGVYRQPNGDLYIYLNQKYWPFIFLGGNTGIIPVKISGNATNVVVHNYNGIWDYAGETAPETPGAIREFIDSLMLNTLIDKETRHALFKVLSGHDFVSWSALLQLMVQIIEQEFYRIYTQPDHEKIKNILFLKKKVIRLQQQMHHTEQLLPGLKNEWNDALLDIYYRAFSTGFVDATEIYAAWHSRIVVQDISKKKKVLESFNIHLKVDEVHKELLEANAKRNELLRTMHTGFQSPHDNPQAILAAKEYEKIKKLIPKGEQLQKISNNIVNKISEYKKLIKQHSDKYKSYDQGEALAKKTLGPKLALSTDQDTTSKIVEEAIIALALQEVEMVIKERDAYSEKDLEELNTIRIARDLVIRMSEQQSAFNYLVNRLMSINIEKHTLSNDYNDIIWANDQAEKINKNNLHFDENSEVLSFLAPTLYWILKNKKTPKDLQGQDFNKIVDGYYSDIYHLNPLTQITKIPEGYTPLSGLLDSEYFSEQKEYVNQFSVYKEKYSAYDASEMTKNLLLISGLTLADILAKTKKRFRINVKMSEHDEDILPGEMLFVQLHDDRWIFFSLFPDALFSKVYTSAEMSANAYLSKITTLAPVALKGVTYGPVYSEDFFRERFGKKESGSLWSFDFKWRHVRTALLSTVYNDEGELKFPTPFTDDKYYGLILDLKENASQPHENLVKTLNTSLVSMFKNTADARKKSLYTPSVLQQIAFAMVPFYREIYYHDNDPEYKIDVDSVLLDVIGIVCVVVGAGIKIAAVLNKIRVIAELLSQGVKHGLVGKALLSYVIRELAKDVAFSALKVLKISVIALIDLIDPLAIKDIAKFTVQHFNKSKSLRSLIPDAQQISQARGINKKYARTDIDIMKMSKQKINDTDVYVPSVSQNSKKEYYISVDDNTYQIRWDNASDTWRTVDPKNPGRFAYGEPVIFENGQWKINKNYGGLRGGGKGASRLAAHADDDVTMAAQPMREGLPQEKVLANLDGASVFDARETLTRLRKVREIEDAIQSPLGKANSVAPYVASFLRKEGFEKIRYRGIAFFANGMDRVPKNHYVVLGTKGGGDYVFDVTARQFSNIYYELNAPIILPESLWAQKYANLTSRSLIKYGDYRSLSTAMTDFDGRSNYFYYGPNSFIPNAFVLRRPRWYYPADAAANAVADAAAAGRVKSPPAEDIKGANPKRKGRPNREDFMVDGKFDEEAYNEARYGEARRRLANTKDLDDVGRRRKAAEVQLKLLSEEEVKSVKVIGEANDSFTLTTIPDKPAETLALNSHGWFTGVSGKYRLPENKELIFLGPHGKTLAEPPGNLPTVTLLAGDAEPIFYASLIRNVQKKVASEFTELTAGTTSKGRVMDYSLMHYEKTPQEELTLAVLLNRQNALRENIDILSVTPAAGRDKKLSDVLNAIDKTGIYGKYNYKKLIFVACREDKRRGAISAALGDSYQIQFKETKSDLAALSLDETSVAGAGSNAGAAKPFAPGNAKALVGEPLPRVRRSIPHSGPTEPTTLMPETTTTDEYEADSDESEFIDFDGILVFEKLTITMPDKKMTSEVLGILPYINPPLSNRKA
ncbi:putative adhesin [Kosakonia oryzendophytica]|nr:hypothetical protein [Kosakonia oryzendophytica]